MQRQRRPPKKTGGRYKVKRNNKVKDNSSGAQLKLAAAKSNPGTASRDADAPGVLRRGHCLKRETHGGYGCVVCGVEGVDSDLIASADRALQAPMWAFD
jgi:hypothetical protein